MAEYYPLLAKAVSSLASPSREARYQIYTRARQALTLQLRQAHPPILESDIERETQSLDKAIERLENEIHQKEQGFSASFSSQKPVQDPLSPPPSPPPQERESAPVSSSSLSSSLPVFSRISSLKGKVPSPPPIFGLGENKPKPLPLKEDSQEIIEKNEIAPPLASPPPFSGAPSVEPFLKHSKNEENEAPPLSGQTSPFLSVSPYVEQNDLPSSFSTQKISIGQELALPSLFVKEVSAEEPKEESEKDEKDEKESAHSEASKEKTSSSSSPDTSSTSLVPLIPVEISRVPSSEPEPLQEEQRLVSVRPRGLFKKIKGVRNQEGKVAFQEIDLSLYMKPPGAQESDVDFAPEVVVENFSRVGLLHPSLPPKRPPRPFNLSHWVVGGALTLIISAIAITAYALRDRPEEFTRPHAENPDSSSDSAAAAKISERIDIGKQGTPSQTEGRSRLSAALSALPIAQRAALLIQTPNDADPNAIATYVGTVTWQTDMKNEEPAQGPTSVIRAEIDIPDVKLKLTALFQKNEDAHFPASHTIEIHFKPSTDSALPPIKQIDTPQMRRDDTPAGDPLSGISMPIRDNNFLVGLTRNDILTKRNIDLILSRNWVDIPLLFTDGRIAKITFEKGASGDRLFSDVIQRDKL